MNKLLKYTTSMSFDTELNGNFDQFAKLFKRKNLRLRKLHIRDINEPVYDFIDLENQMGNN